MIFEVCLQSVDGAVAAQAGGAQRVELCAALIEGGITPSHATIQQCRDAVDIDIMVMIRPRGGDFDYTDRELEVMLTDIEFCKSVGVDGVVFGVLNPDGSLARTQGQTLFRGSGQLQTVFHRAFDVSRNPTLLLDELIDLGCTRVLTSGQAASAPEGSGLIADLIQQADGRIEVLPGAGLTPENIAGFLAETGADQFHATAFGQLESRMQHRNPEVYMGIPGLPEYHRQVTDEAVVRAFLAAVS